MSYSFDGKVSNQHASIKLNGDTTCGCCRKLIPIPHCKFIEPIKDIAFAMHHYINTPYYIYETKSAFAVVYCSDKCRRKHNHRFNRRVIDNADKIAMATQRFWTSLKIGDRVFDTLVNKDAYLLYVDSYKALVSTTIGDRTDYEDDGVRYLWEIAVPKDRSFK